jgi:hypothetical protein
MKKTIIYLTVLLIITAVSCTKNFTAINTNPGAFVAAEPEAVLPGVFVNTINKFETVNLTTLWEYTHIIDPAGRYNVPAEGNVWTNDYVTVLGNTKQLRNLYTGNPGYTNRIAITDIWECYVYFYLVGSYGPIPYTHMGDTSPVIAYDDENTIYTSLLSRLKADAAAINTTTTGDKFPTDPIYGGNMTQWIKFANSLRLRIALTVQVNLPALAATNIADVMANENTLLTSDADDPKLSYGTATGSQSPYYTNLVLTTNYINGAYPVMSETAWTWFRTYNDPRMSAYFAPSQTPIQITDTLTSTADALHHIVTYQIPYAGQALANVLLAGWSLNATPADPSGTYPLTAPTNAQVNMSQLQPSIIGTSASMRPFYIMTYAEVCFMKAEARLNYPSVGSKTADVYYYAGINANFAMWGLTQAQANTYQQQQGIQWGTAAAGFNGSIGLYRTNLTATDNAKRIWLQEWLNYFPDEAFEAWVLLRRTQAFVLPPHTNPGGESGLTTNYENLPDRYNYPIANEAVVNPIGYAAGVKLLSNGQDWGMTPLKFEPPYTPINWAVAHPFCDISFVQKYYPPLTGGPATIQSTAAGLLAAGLKPYVQTGTY